MSVFTNTPPTLYSPTKNSVQSMGFEPIIPVLETGVLPITPTLQLPDHHSQTLNNLPNLMEEGFPPSAKYAVKIKIVFQITK